MQPASSMRICCLVQRIYNSLFRCLTTHALFINVICCESKSVKGTKPGEGSRKCQSPTPHKYRPLVVCGKNVPHVWASEMCLTLSWSHEHCQSILSWWTLALSASFQRAAIPAFSNRANTPQGNNHTFVVPRGEQPGPVSLPEHRPAKRSGQVSLLL